MIVSRVSALLTSKTKNMNSPDTHSAMIIGEGFSAFIDGIPDKCEHQWDGATAHMTQSGQVIWWHTFRKWASYTSMFRDQLIYEHQYDVDDPVMTSAATCSKCGKVFHPPMF